MKSVIQIIMALSTGISIVSPIFSKCIPLWFVIVISGLGILCFILLTFDAIKKNHINERICTSEKEIEETMKGIITTQGKICIISRALSWVTPEIMACLEGKKDNVLIFAQTKNETTQKLLDRGIKVMFYGKFNFEPKSRFTIIRYNKNNPQVAIANSQYSVRRGAKFKHVIYQTSANGDPRDQWINSLAIDMVNLCSLVCAEKEKL